MKKLIEIVTSLILFVWPVAALMSMMAFDAPGSERDPKTIGIALTMVFIPVIFGALYALFNQTFMGMSPKSFLLITAIVSVSASVFLGYPSLIVNYFK